MVGREKISVVVPHYNNLEKLEQCLDGLLQQDESPTLLEIIVVDNNSTVDLSQLKQKFSSVAWLSETSRQSPYPTRNQGIRAAGGDIIVLLDSNCVPLPNFFQQGLQQLTECIDVCGGQLSLQANESIASRFDLLYSVIRPDHKPVECLPGGVLFVKRAVFDHIGLFLAEVRSLGDIEWTTRAYKNGYTLGITAQPVATYRTKAFSAFCRKMIRLGLGKKEVYVQRGGRLYHFRWWLKSLKCFLPPSPVFVNRMWQLNLSEATQLNYWQIIAYCWWTKVLRGVGMAFGKTNRNNC